jgi:disulfide oxidoreductase YuzD
MADVLEELLRRKEERVEFRDDYIAIINSKEEEIIGWHRDEWMEDSEVVFSIVNAARIAYGEPNNTVNEMINEL